MTPQNSLDHKGKLSTYPFAELLVEIGQAKLDGSMRLSGGDSKAIVYFRDGAVVYAVSNAREHRLVNVLVDSRRLEQTAVPGLPKFSNDVELAGLLTAHGILRKEEVDDAVVAQIETILISVLTWPDGDWHYSPLVRAREDLIYRVKIHKVLMDYARCQPMNSLLTRFKSMKETFARAGEIADNAYLQAHEDYVLQRFGTAPRSIEELTLECGLPENGFLQALYVLWLGGMLSRQDWNAAFSANRIGAIRNARIELVKQAIKTNAAPTNGKEAKEEAASANDETPAVSQPIIPELSLSDYLSRVEAARTHYDVLGVDSAAATPMIKASYFSLAKLFHPDRFHRESADTLQRIQAAFSNVQVAYDTLKSSDTRENYDYKVRKELEVKEKLKAQGMMDAEAEKVDAKAEQGLENFEAGLSLLMDEDYEGAIPFLGRAAHYNPENALYRAYFGKALSYDSKQRHRAEGEMQAAVKVDPKNQKIRMMLIEFFVENNLMKRAEGELKRFLELVPDSVEAKRMLAEIQTPAA